MSFKKYYFLIVITALLFISETSFGQTNQPPVITAVGNQPYCPGNSINIAASVTIVDTDDVGIEAMYIQISTGYKRNQDLLALTGTHPNVTSQWNANTGKLKLSGTSTGNVLYTDFIAAILAIEFTTSNTSATGSRYFSITIGDANYLPSSDHFYEYISAIGITWTSAKTEAETRTYFGLQGYLATITSSEEAQLSGEQAAGAGWIGGSDSQTEGVWKWMTGPEIGTTFWNGLINGSTPNFANWNTAEPNQAGDEDYAHVTAPGIGIPGSWNDLSNTGAFSGDYQPKGYIIEYGGMPGDPTLNISASTSIHIPAITTVTSNSRCGDGTIILEAIADFGIINWYDATNGGNLVGTGSTFATPNIITNTTYYVSTSIAGCNNGLRTPVNATVYAIPKIDSTIPDTICFNGSGSLQATSTPGSIINWYDAPSGGTSLANGNLFTTPNVSTTTIFYVDASTTTCTTATRTPVTLTVYSPIAPTGDSNQYYCEQNYATVSELVTNSGADIKWYDALTGGIMYTSTEILIDGQIYYASQNDGTCESFDRLQVIATIYEAANPLDSSNITNLYFCDNTSVGTDTDGLIIFDLTQRETDILNGQSSADFTLTYFTDANYLNLIVNPISFQNTISGRQTIYVRMTNNMESECSNDTSFNIEVFELPVIQSTMIFKNCDEDGNPDGFTDYNLDEANDYITNGDTSLNVTYYTSFANADSGSNPVSSFPFNNATTSTVYARIKTVNGCHRVSTIDLDVSTTSFPPGYSYALESCDNDDIIDGLNLFDLSIASADMIAQFPTGQNLSVQYYRNGLDAQLEQNEILPQNAYMSEFPFNQILYVRVESDDNGECFGIGPHLNLTVFPRPDFQVISTAIVCLNLSPITLEAFNPIGVYTYEWTDQNNKVISTSSTVDVTTGGVYTVIATSTDGNDCESFPHTITVNESIIATIGYDDVTITDDSDNNTVTINNENNNLGIGDYEFSLNDEFGPYQDEPFFDSVAPGIHIIYVKDKNNCGIAMLEISVIGFPKFFTPNNDGYNDNWQVLGISQYFFPSSLIYIYDRFGKILAKVSPTSIGWDGFYNGKILPSDDYWFSVQLIDNNGINRNRKGSFSLIRR